jgi:hypothetical protein
MSTIITSHELRDNIPQPRSGSSRTVNCGGSFLRLWFLARQLHLGLTKLLRTAQVSVGTFPTPGFPSIAFELLQSDVKVVSYCMSPPTPSIAAGTVISHIIRMIARWTTMVLIHEAVARYQY